MKLAGIVLIDPFPREHGAGDISLWRPEYPEHGGVERQLLLDPGMELLENIHL